LKTIKNPVKAVLSALWLYISNSCDNS